MQRHIDEVVAEGFEAAEQVVETERQHGERPVGLVRAGVTQRSAPEVVDEQAPDGRRRQQVGVLHDRPTTTTYKHQKMARYV